MSKTKGKVIRESDFRGIVRYCEKSLSGLVWDTTIWVGKTKNRAATFPGKQAGTLNKASGYYQFRFNRKTYRCHRVIYALFNKECPENFQIDHIDGNKTNNLIENLRVVSDSESNKNRVFSNNTDLPFTHWSEKLNRFQVAFTLDGERKCKTFKISVYGTIEKARQAAEKYLEDNREILLANSYVMRVLNKE